MASKLQKWQEDVKRRQLAGNGHLTNKAGFSMEVNGHHPEREIPPQYQGVMVELPADIRKMFEYGWS